MGVPTTTAEGKAKDRHGADLKFDVERRIHAAAQKSGDDVDAEYQAKAQGRRWIGPSAFDRLAGSSRALKRGGGRQNPVEPPAACSGPSQRGVSPAGPLSRSDVMSVVVQDFNIYRDTRAVLTFTVAPVRDVSGWSIASTAAALAHRLRRRSVRSWRR
jgi:hypothetical protein